ncbi:hypothetical protein ASPBRDRAFT_417418 [Aspergillus brasiliensis CBS 101740]|uniref:Uncharacterized protein n=1 Tax=Aspergillus brasiliensis (strain CBS 101740 / IMI 381727 / IBT 21946) TaxID=767769 RepID=A0A1L9UYH0_ASPBC|nr:hypothetical protein ASPBRDRAFT_417418 [Aspergillus brasiliensis CBS 101740]
MSPSLPLTPFSTSTGVCRGLRGPRTTSASCLTRPHSRCALWSAARMQSTGFALSRTFLPMCPPSRRMVSTRRPALVISRPDIRMGTVFLLLKEVCLFVPRGSHGEFPGWIKLCPRCRLLREEITARDGPRQPA